MLNMTQIMLCNQQDNPTRVRSAMVCLRPSWCSTFFWCRAISSFEILPTLKDKRQAVDISQQIEEGISAYLVTITIMNAAVGVATAAAMYLCGLGDPLLWGATGFLLN